MAKPGVNEIMASLRQDEARLHAMEALSPAIQRQYAQGIEKLRLRIHEERAAVGLSPCDTEAWARRMLDDIDYYEYPKRVSDEINQCLLSVEAAREGLDLQGMTDLQRRLEQYIHDLQTPRQLKFEA